MIVAKFSRLGLLFMLVETVCIVCMDCSSAALKDSSRCGDWIPYKDEKCIKIVDRAGFQNQQAAEAVCNAFSEGSNREFLPTLITIKTLEEQQFLQNMLFAVNNVVDNVWIGLREVKSSGVFTWNDATEVLYSNWANQTLHDIEHRCVHMASGKGINTVGQWVKVDCRIGNRVVCERRQIWSLEMLHSVFLNHIQEFETLKGKHEAAVKEIQLLKQNPVPPGFIYVQIPGQRPPGVLWPSIQWIDVSSSYAGLFFRVAGGNAAPFGQVQAETTKRLLQVQHVMDGKHVSPLSIPADGSWSECVHTGSFTPGETQRFATKFRLSTDEVRPRNQAVKVWQSKL